MNFGFLTEDVKVTKVAAYASANTTDVTGTSVDMAGYDGVVFLASFGTGAADNLIHAEQSSDNSSFTDIAGSEPNDAGASSELQFVDIINPAARYVRPIAVRGTSTTVENIYAIQYRAKTLPQDNKIAGTIEGEQLINPIAGTK